MPWAEGAIAERWSLRTAILAGACCPLLLAAVVALIWLADRATPTKHGKTGTLPMLFFTLSPSEQRTPQKWGERPPFFIP